ncbi:MAG: hypothetical protein RQ723_00375 [Desulfuromonadales bacterium]|nr:hypothetical protein [Desulfuromonadales bacterium]
MSHYVDERDALLKKQLVEKLKRAEKEARRKAIKERECFRGLQIRPTASFFDDAEKKEPGEDNWVGLGFDIHPHVTFVALRAVLIGRRLQ